MPFLNILLILLYEFCVFYTIFSIVNQIMPTFAKWTMVTHKSSEKELPLNVNANLHPLLFYVSVFTMKKKPAKVVIYLCEVKNIFHLGPRCFGNCCNKPKPTG